jgi:sugar O-acyltransferase (sialic acid O-acetyltransferase NeuD family)
VVDLQAYWTQISQQRRTGDDIVTISQIVCWGAKGQAKVLNEFLPLLGYQLVACFDNDPNILSPFEDVPLIGNWTAFAKWREQNSGPMSCIVAIGGQNGCDRLNIQSRLASSRLTPVILVHPTAFVARGARLGAGTQILAMSAVCVDARLGDACIVNTRASVDHECTIANGVHIGPGATLCGEVRVDECAFIGAGATILPRVHIGRGAVVGAGALVSRDVPPESCVVGIPARIQTRA